MTENETGGLRPKYQTYTQQKCFIAYSEQAHWSVDLLDVCEEILNRPEYNFEVDYARKHFAANASLRQKVLELIANARCGIYDISYWRLNERSSWQMPRNVMIELGIAVALNRPILLLRHANNRELPLPECLQCLSDQILEFCGIEALKTVLAKHLPNWINIAPEVAWWNRHCCFGGRICDYREAHPRAKQLDRKELICTVADGSDLSRQDFRAVIGTILERFNDISYNYLDSLTLREDYNFLLCTYCQAVRSSPLAIYRITSETTVDSFIAIGITLALEIQFEYDFFKVLITEDIQNIPSLLAEYEIIISQNNKQIKKQLQEFIPKIIRKIREIKWKSKPLPFLEKSVGFFKDDPNIPLPSEAQEQILEDNLTTSFSRLGNINLEKSFPNLNSSNYTVQGVATPIFNSVAFALGEFNRWIWPDVFGQSYWPSHISREETLESFISLFQDHGYERCDGSTLEPGFEKVAIYTNSDGKPTHVARQFSTGHWGSKLGKAEDIKHENLDVLSGGIFGYVACLMKRPSSNATS